MITQAAGAGLTVVLPPLLYSVDSHRGSVGANNQRRCHTCSKHNRSHLPDPAAMV